MKTKVRLTALDIMALVTELKAKLLNTRLSNIYNADAKTYIFKFSLQEEKSYLIIENGMRFNLTDKIEKNKVPSGFTMKFRKYLRSRRLEQIEQIGVERVVVFTFGREEHAYHLILELYSQGNIILTDKDYRIIQLTRQHEFSENDKVAPGEIYPFQRTATNYIEKFDTSVDYLKKVASEKSYKFKEILFVVIPCLHAQLTEDLINQCGFSPNTKITLENLNQVKQTVDFAMDYLHKFRQQTHYRGYLVAKQPPQKEGDRPKYFDFAPDLALYHKDKFVQEIQNFNEAVDKYFEVIDKTEDNKPTIEDIAWKKFENIKQDQMSRINKLQAEQDEFMVKARLIEENLDEVQAIIDLVNGLVGQSVDWNRIERMINNSKKDGHPLCNMIGGMNLAIGQITIYLGERDDEYAELVKIDLDLSLSAYQNAGKYFQNKKKHKQKEVKTKEAVDQALKQAEKTALKEIEKEKNKVQKVQNARKKYWFEKFYWFISTDGYLVISGRDVQQNELVVKKYMGKDDIYMHADIHGSASTIIKNLSTGQIPDTTLMQAATATICRSKAWDAKIVVSAWWVYASQVTKSAPAGLFVPAGSFMIYGKKNYVYPPRLEMGATILYQLDQESIKRHEVERQKKLLEENIDQEEQELDQDPSETTEKNMFDSDEEEPQQQPEEQGGTVQTMVKEGQEITIVEVNPNARIVQQRNDKKQKEKEQQGKPQQPQGKQQQQGKQQGKPQTQQKQPQQQQAQQTKQPQQKKKADDESGDESDKKNQKQPQNTKAKKHKVQKMKEKYKDQSDEERELRMKLMGANYMKGEKKPDKKQKQREAEISEKDGAKDKQGKYQPKAQQSLTEKLLLDQGIQAAEKEQKQQQLQEQQPEREKEDQFLELKEQRQQQPQEPRAQDIALEQQAQEKALDESNKDERAQKETLKETQKETQKDNQNEQADQDSDLDAEDKQEAQEEENIEYAEMQKLVSYLYQDDVYLSVVPMVAPYQCISQSKFKMKIGPGSVKKGRAAKDIINYFLSLKDLSPTERAYLKLVSDDELVQQMLSGSKLTAAGMLLLKQKEKQQKKQQQKK